ncbi:O-antigen ligase family protein [Solimonas terrae]|uniref:O-antigen ligase-related domain-containing protein n=1 Tax=Solimonas terrae TaxID=1396819 RepID=A0A6M2BR80_9GAMM|nr:O-antigen ligase family protein [Solimonas terrae]NGY04527.1 hypothetical protein [Solimonas terrae]
MNKQLSAAAIFVAVFCAPFQWIQIAGSLTISDLGFVMSAGLLLCGVVFSAAYFPNFRSNFIYWFLILYVANLIIQVVSLVHSPKPMQGLFDILRDAIYLSWVILLFSGISRIGFVDACRIIYRAAFISGIGVLIVASIQLAHKGIHPIDVYVRAFVDLDPDRIQYSVFKGLFNETDADTYSSATRHTMALLFTLGLACAKCVAYVNKRERHFSAIVQVFLAALILATLSRQAIVALLWVFMSSSVFMSGDKRKARYGIVLGFFVSVALAIPAWDFIKIKFIDDILENPRVERYGQALIEISKHPFWGYGAGSLVDNSYYADQYVINAWHQGGLMSLIAAVGVTLLLLLQLLRPAFSRLPEGKKIFCLWCSWLAIFPLIRLLVSLRGTFDMSACIALALLFFLAGQLLNRGDSRQPNIETNFRFQNWKLRPYESA